MYCGLLPVLLPGPWVVDDLAAPAAQLGERHHEAIGVPFTVLSPPTPQSA